MEGCAEWQSTGLENQGVFISLQVRVLHPPLSYGVAKNSCARNGTVGSNPTPAAILRYSYGMAIMYYVASKKDIERGE